MVWWSPGTFGDGPRAWERLGTHLYGGVMALGHLDTLACTWWWPWYPWWGHGVLEGGHMTFLHMVAWSLYPWRSFWSSYDIVALLLCSWNPWLVIRSLAPLRLWKIWWKTNEDALGWWSFLVVNGLVWMMAPFLVVVLMCWSLESLEVLWDFSLGWPLSLEAWVTCWTWYLVDTTCETKYNKTTYHSF